MKLFIVSMLLAAVYTVGSCYRPTAGRRTPFVTRSQFARMCAEIVSIKEANSNLQKTVTDLEQRLEDQEQISKDAENKIASLEQDVDELKIQINQPEIQSAFAIYGFYPDEPESGVMTMSEDAVITNIGDDFDPETGRYTAPVDGTYIFDLNLYKLGNSLPFVRCYLRKNGEKVAVAFIPDNVLSEHEGSATTVLQLMENDVVDVGDCNDVGKIDSYTSFSGYLHRTD